MTRERQVSDSIVIAAPAAEVFAVLADPRQHPRFDGSGTVRGVVTGPDVLTLGSRFGMRMRMGLPYRVKNTVVEYEQDRRIGWRHAGRHVWRYDLEPVEGGTRVTETFDWTHARLRLLFDRISVPESNARAITATLGRLKALLEGGQEQQG